MTQAEPEHTPKVLPKLAELVAVLERLRAPGGCAWDRAQSHGTLVPHLIEECYELVEAIETGDYQNLLEELGDVLYQVIFHADIAAESGHFTLEDVAEYTKAKMVHRHPHVFADTVAETLEAVSANWEKLKQVEKPERTSVLDGIPKQLPALALASKMVSRAERVGISLAHEAPPEDEQSLGRQILKLVAAARGVGMDAERALRGVLRELASDIRGQETRGYHTPYA